MKKLCLSVLCGLVSTFAAIAAEAPAPAAAAPAAKNPTARTASRRSLSPEDRAKMMKARRERMMKAAREGRGYPVPGVVVQSFGKTASGVETHLYRVMGLGGMVMDFSDHGARVVRILAPDKNGNLADITTGHNSVAGYERYDAGFGATIGRYGNRIAAGKFTLDGATYTLPLNNGPDDLRCCLHGGIGFDKVVWKAMPIRRGRSLGVLFIYESPDGDQGFPGKLDIRVTHMLSDKNVWSIEYNATVQGKATPINLTNHVYFNLKGVGNGTILDHELTLFADKITPVNRGLIPTGGFMDVKGTPFDFTTPHVIGDRINDKNEQLGFGGGYDHNWVLRNQNGTLAKAAFVSEKTSGRTIEVWTTEPGVQFYSGCQMSVKEPVPSKDGKMLPRFGGLALETQHYPDSPNHAEFPSTILKPGAVYTSRTEYHFGVTK